MTLNHNITVRSLQIVSHITLVIGLVLAINSDIEIERYLWIVFGYAMVVGTLGTNIGMHRLLSHRSFETWKPIEYVCAFFGSLGLLGSPIAWCAAHRYHHIHSDQESDIHSPKHLGTIKSWFGLWPNVKIPARIVSDLTKNSYYRFLHKHYLSINVIYAGILYLIDPWFLVFVWALYAVYTFHAVNSINVLLHKVGYQNHNTGDDSKNSLILQFVTHFEGWHNNHHANPGKYRHGEKWWEFDLPAWIIELIKKR